MTIKVPRHLSSCRRCVGLYRLLARAYAPDHGAEYDGECDERHLCDRCGATSCGTHGCECTDVLCPHGRQNLRRLDSMREHAELLDKNWATLHEASVGAIRDALGMPEATVPEMVQRIEQMRASGGR